MKKGIFCFGVIVLLALNVLASVDYSDSTFSIKLPYSQTLRIGNNKSPVFIETKSGKYCFQGTPAAILKSENVCFFNWVLDGNKEIKLTFTNNLNECKIQLETVGIENITKWGFSIQASKDEYFTGMMERVIDGEQRLSWQPGIKEAMNLRGQFLTTVVKPTTSLYCPFYISSNNYSLFVEGTWPGEFDFCRSNPDLIQATFEGPFTAVVINTAESPAELVKKHSLRVGPTIIPPRWAFGTCRWRDEHSNEKAYYDGTPVAAPYNSQVVEDVLMMKAFDIPLSYYLVDRPWAKGSQGFDDFEWDSNRFPNATDMISWLDSKDVKFILWIGPWVMGDMHKEAIAKNYCVQGQLTPKDKLDKALIDFSNPAAVEWWQKGIEKLLTQGVNGFKMDRAEEIVPNDYNNKSFDGRTAREYHNDYPVMYAKAAHDIAKLVHGNDFITMPRAGYTNSSRYAVFWGGDTGAGSKGGRTVPEALRAAIIALQKSAVIGFPIWGSDTGGYMNITDHEVTARWLAFSCFCPIMEVGPTEDRGLWDLTEEPRYDKELIAIWRLYSKIHESLMDYSYQQAKDAATAGMPIARPLFLNYGDQPQAWQDWQTYMYGPDILVSAIWEKGKTQQSLYLPAGEKWIDAWDTKKVYTGGQTITVDTPRYKIPIFIRQGGNVSLGNLNKLYRQSLKLASKKPDLKKLQNKEFSNK